MVKDKKTITFLQLFYYIWCKDCDVFSQSDVSGNFHTNTIKMDKKEFEELKHKFETETRSLKVSKLFSFMTTFISVLGIAVLTYYFAQTLFSKNVDQEKKEEYLMNENKLLKNKLVEIENRIKIISPSDTITSESQKRIEVLEKKIENLNAIILENPEKSLTIPLLKKDIENIKSDNSVKIELVRDKVETVVDLNKWILGLIFSLLITLVLTNLSKSKKDKEE